MLNFYRSNKKPILIGVGTLVALIILGRRFIKLGMNKDDFWELVENGGIAYPTKTIRKVSSGFGTRNNPFTKQSQFHNGIDIPAPSKTPVYAPIDGEVTLNSYHVAGGNQIVIQNGDIRFGFAHLFEKPKFAIGDKIKKGQQIGLIGNTGTSTGSHLHFTMKINDVFIDPRKAFSEYV